MRRAHLEAHLAQLRHGRAKVLHGGEHLRAAAANGYVDLGGRLLNKRQARTQQSVPERLMCQECEGMVKAPPCYRPTL